MKQLTVNSEQLTADSEQLTTNSERQALPDMASTGTDRHRILFTVLFAVNCSLLTALGCHSGPPPMPLDQLNAQQTHGHAVFQVYCRQCHDDRDSSALHGPALLGVFKKQYLPSGAPANDDRVSTIIQQGYGLMPSVPNMDPQDRDDLLAYLHTL